MNLLNCTVSLGGEVSYNMRYTNDSMYRQRVVYFLVTAMLCMTGVIIGSAVALGQTNSALVPNSPEQSNLIIDCSFGEAGKEDCSVRHFFQLANNIMKLLLWVAVTGAGILIFYKGTKLAINVFVKGGQQQARKEVQDALKATAWGLIFILGAYLVVKAGFDIIGYNLNDGDPFTFDESSLPAPDVSKLKPSSPPPAAGTPASPPVPGQVSPPAPTPPKDTSQTNTSQAQTETAQCAQAGGGVAPCTCTDCTTPTGIAFKNNTKVHKVLAGKLVNLKSAIANPSWVVTEAWPTTSGHSGQCHYVGTCVDIDFDSRYSDADIKTFIQKAKEVGLLAVFETKNQLTADRLINNGIPANNVLQWDTITGDHFSVYDCSLPSPPSRC